ncbi:MAG TPA: hypothetical protein VLG12_06740, partial [Candidatus Saccharimonadales bacterium]|nr:hypothetical protein [Candidatus Saccharimonadales bacterium]
MKSITNKGGRPEISEIQKEEILRKLQPYLQSGISISKALQEVHIPPSTFYDLMKKDQRFSDKITRFK